MPPSYLDNDEHTDRFEIIFESDNYLQLNLAGTLPDSRQAFQTVYIDKAANYFFLKKLFPAIGQRGWTYLANQGTYVTLPLFAPYFWIRGF